MMPWNRKLSTDGLQTQEYRKKSADSSRLPSGLDPSQEFYRRRRSIGNSSIPDDSESSPKSFPVTTKHQPTNESSGAKPSNLEVSQHSPTTSLSLGSRYIPNVSDWNDKTHRVARSSSDGDSFWHTTDTRDPPRPAREGHEWVWFPEGYWAEREKPDQHLKHSRTIGRFQGRKSADRNDPSVPPKGVKSEKPSAVDIDGPRIKIGSNKFRGESSQNSQMTEPTTPASRIKMGLSYVSPVYPHFTSPTGQPEGLYCKVKRRIGSKARTNMHLVIMLSLLAGENGLIVAVPRQRFDSRIRTHWINNGITTRRRQ